MLTLFLFYVSAGFLLIVISLPLIGEKIRPNYFYGFRVPKTLKNPSVWYAANRYAGKRLLVTGFVTILAAGVFYLVPGIGIDTYAMACLIVIGLTMTITLVQSFRYLNTL